MDFEMKLGWGKNVPIPPQPIYVHPSQSHIIRPPKQSGLPFNCQIPYKQRKENLPFDGVGFYARSCSRCNFNVQLPYKIFCYHVVFCTFYFVFFCDFIFILSFTV